MRTKWVKRNIKRRMVKVLDNKINIRTHGMRRWQIGQVRYYRSKRDLKIIQSLYQPKVEEEEIEVWPDEE